MNVSNLKRRFSLYVALIIFLTILLTISSTFMVSREGRHSEIINTSGQQRMFSQNIALLSLEMTNSDSDSRQKDIRNDLNNSIKKMRSNHETLVGDVREEGFFESGTDELREIYFDEPDFLDNKTKVFLNHANMLAKNGNIDLDNQHLQEILRISPKLLLALDKAVTINQAAAENDLLNIQILFWITTLLLVILILSVALFIFRPMIKKVEQDATNLEAINKKIKEAKVIAEIANKAKSDFLANMSHELRTPLNAIIGFSQEIKDESPGPINEVQQEFVDYILESGKHLLSLINDILDLSKIEAGKVELELSEFDLKTLLENSVALVKQKVLQHNFKLSVDISDDIEYVTADERKIKQIVFNILSNATKFTPDGRTIGVEAEKSDSGEVLVSVWDTGIGIEKRDRSKVFATFEQVASDYSKAHPGSGLGMPLTKQLVELHGGKIWFESEGKDKGTRFSFTIPQKFPASRAA